MYRGLSASYEVQIIYLADFRQRLKATLSCHFFSFSCHIRMFWLPDRPQTESGLTAVTGKVFHSWRNENVVLFCVHKYDTDTVSMGTADPDQ